MEFEEEIAELKELQKQSLKNYIAMSTRYNKLWAEYLDVSEQIRQIRARQDLRTLEGFNPSKHFLMQPGFGGFGQSIPEPQHRNGRSFEERQRSEKQLFEHHNDEKTLKVLNEQLTKSRENAKVSLQCMDEIRKFLNINQHL